MEKICTGLGVSQYHLNLSDKKKAFLEKNFQDFKQSVQEELGATSVEILDVTLDENIEHFSQILSERKIKLNGSFMQLLWTKPSVIKKVKPLLDVTKEEFCNTMDVSAYSLIRLSHYLLKHNVLQRSFDMLIELYRSG